MINILFVCLGNICRSPMAEAVAKQQIQQMGLSDKINVDSAGTGDWHIGHPPHVGTQRILDTYGIDYKGMKARQFDLPDFTGFHYIVCMDRKNLQDVLNLQPDSDARTSQIVPFMQFVPGSELEDVPDPYFTGNFEEVYELVQEGCDQLIRWVIEREDMAHV
ncbi:hypothetical protein SY83_17625 [Paenibacillus swuensis]|uniref:protein-tyrosine-phosphatase n=1 Tax=Paenibacillus swuensis TaxID=1178515 RepID=A0A172TL71_9BACL|nr:low molecular weight protein-tyrosine-phosphatase [Paenibacillus swuensis]ANE47805.1 hypothetical protein SY83_17625 [Paenibacillus swuensis]